MTLASLSRRDVLLGASAVIAAGSAPAFAKAPLLNTQAPAFYRFKIGAIEATMVSDGPLDLGEPKPDFFVGLGKDQIDKKLTDNFQPTKNLRLEQNALILNTGDKLVLVDTGTGAPGAFGPNSGRLLTNLKAAGIEAKDIDAVVLTHAHPDHCWGIMGPNGARNFPNAQFYLSQADFDFWTDEGKRSLPFIGDFIAPTRAALLPNRDRMVFIKDGQEILPGIQAMSAPGHTVGHTIYMVTSQGATLALTADLAHHPLLILENPQVQFGFDTDPKQGSATRIRVFDMLAAQKLAVHAYHFPWPGIGHVVKQGDGFRYIPAPMQTVL
jgi:glyoxylase-like metal-dependent hydrolase (beta-lactamase superfamily II)